MSILKVGIAGYGVVGRRRKQCIDANPYMEVVAVCDRKFSTVQTEENGIAVYSNLQNLLGHGLDVLIVCLTNEVAANATIVGLQNGLHVFCEKPPGRDFEDIRRVIKLSRQRPELKLMYGFNHRYHHSVKDALRIINSGELGKVINLRGVYGKSKIITFNQEDWRTKREIAGGGVLLDQGIHMVDLIRLFAGDFFEVHSFISNDYWGYNVEDNAYALMRGTEGVVAMLNSSATQWRHRFNLDITLEKGSLILGGILSGSKSYGAEMLTVVTADPENDNGDPKEQVTRYNEDPSWNEEITSFSNAIVKDTPVRHGTADDALKTMELVYRIYFADAGWRDRFNIQNPDKCN